MQDTNSLQDEIRVSRSQIRHLPFSKKAEYYWGYYKYHGLIILVLAIALGNIIHSTLTKKETMLSIAYINAFPNIEDEIFIEGFEKYLALNPKKQEVLLDSGYYLNDGSASPYAATYHQKFSTRCMAGLIDVVVADESNFTQYGAQGFFTDLNNIFTKDQLAQYADNLLYVEVIKDDGAVTIPVGINVTSLPGITSTASYVGSVAYLGIVNGSTKEDTAVRYLSFLAQP